MVPGQLLSRHLSADGLRVMQLAGLGTRAVRGGGYVRVMRGDSTDQLDPRNIYRSQPR
jgi:hypothetical protein